MNLDFLPPLECLSLGAGVQSSTLALMASEGEIPMPVCGIFADTQGEPESVYKWLSFLCGVEVKYDAEGWAYIEPGCYQSGVLKFPVYIVTAGSLEATVLNMTKTEDGRTYSKVNIPFFTRNHDGTEGKVKHRACTRDFKIVPVRALQRHMVAHLLPEWRRKHRPALRELQKWKIECRRINKLNKEREKPDRLPTPLRPHGPWTECQSDPLVHSWVGISLDEIGRVKESRDPWLLNTHQLIDARMHRHDCELWLKKRGLEAPRSACYYCPFRNPDEWRRMRAEEPRYFSRAGTFEGALQAAKGTNFRTTPFLTRYLVPLAQVDFSTEEDRGQGNLFYRECEGYCGT